MLTYSFILAISTLILSVINVQAQSESILAEIPYAVFVTILKYIIIFCRCKLSFTHKIGQKST